MAEQGDVPEILIGGKHESMKTTWRKVRAAEVKPEAVEILRPKDYHPSTASFTDVMFDAIHGKKADVRDQSLQEALNRVDFAEGRQWFKRGEIKAVMTDTLETSTWDEKSDDYFYKRMIEKGRSVEVEMQGVAGYNTLKHQGMMEQMFVTVANQVSAEGVDERRPLEEEKIRQKMTGEGKSDDEINEAIEKWYSGWLDEKMISHQGATRLEERRQIAERARLVGFPPDMKLAKLVGTRPRRDAAEADYLAGGGGGAFEHLIEQLQENQITMQKYFELAAQQNQTLLERYSQLDPETERERWIDVGYRRGFFSRFTPQMEPEFFKRIKDDEERRLYEDRWQLHRSAFYKKSVHFKTDAYKENADLNQVSNEQMERLYNSPGVKNMLEEYVSIMHDGADISLTDVEGNPLLDGDGNQRKMAFWDIESEQDLEDLRATMRRRVLLSDPGFRQELPHLAESLDDDDEQKAEKLRKLQIEAKQVDAVVLDMMYVGNLVESLDSRYSWGGKRHEGFPLMMLCSDDARLILHPQEKFEAKIMSRHNGFGPLVGWGVNFVDPIREQNIVIDRTDPEPDPEKKRKLEPDIEWVPASGSHEYWTVALLEERNSDGRRRVTVRVPEAYPITALKSFYEQYRVEDENGRQDTPLEHLKEKRKIDWKTLKGSWGDYNGVKFGKAVSYYGHYSGNRDAQMDFRLDSQGSYLTGMSNWANTLMELRERLKQPRLIDEVEKDDRYVTYQTDENIKVWAVIGSSGGVRDETKKTPKVNMGWTQHGDIQAVLKDGRVGYLKKGENLEIN